MNKVTYKISNFPDQLTVFFIMNPPKSMNFFLLEILEPGLGPTLDWGIDMVFFTGSKATSGTALGSVDILTKFCRKST